MAKLERLVEELVTANRILAREGIVDSFGHISVRHPDNPQHFLLWSQVVTGVQVNEHGNVRVLTVAEWHERRECLHTYGSSRGRRQAPPLLFRGMRRVVRAH